MRAPATVLMTRTGNDFLVRRLGFRQARFALDPPMGADFGGPA